MSSRLTGQYLPGQSLLHRLDPRAKLFGFLLFAAAVIAADTPFGYAAVFVFVLALLFGEPVLAWYCRFL